MYAYTYFNMYTHMHICGTHIYNEKKAFGIGPWKQKLELVCGFLGTRPLLSIGVSIRRGGGGVSMGPEPGLALLAPHVSWPCSWSSGGLVLFLLVAFCCSFSCLLN